MGGHRTKNDTRDVTQKPWEFLAVFLVIFFIACVFLFSVDFVPEAPKNNTAPQAPVALAAENQVSYPVEAPERIQIPSVGIDTKVENPTSLDEKVLDNALLSGAARYPASALLGENARVFIFGHQSYLPVVHNQAFKAFNGLQKAKVGDDIVVTGTTTEYHYRVVSVEHASADQALVDLGPGERLLTLSTCDSFGSKTDRWVVRAEFVSTEPIS